MANLSNINNKFLVTTTGEVLVGRTATTGTSKLQVSGSLLVGTDISSGIPLVVQETTTDGFAIGFMRNTNATNGNGLVIDVNSTGGAYIQDWRQASTVKMRLLQNGNLGIGTDSPGSRKLSVVKDTGITAGFNDIAEFLDTTLGGGGSVSLNIGRANSSKNLGKMAFKYVSSGSNSNTLNFGFYDADNLMTIQAGGNVGIGVTSPGAKLDVVGPSNGSAILKLQRNGVGAYQYFVTDIGSGAQQLFCDAQQADSGFVFRTRDSGNATITALYIAPSGNVGIGNNSPDEKLEISGDGTSYPHIKLSNPSQTGRYLKIGMIDSVNHCIETVGGSTYLTFKTVSAERMRITSGGNVGIGTTSPQRLLHLRSTNEATGIFLERSANYGFVQYNQVVGSVETYHLGFVNNNTFSSDILVANESGNVGIGVTSPNAKLDVNGALKAQRFFSRNGSFSSTAGNWHNVVDLQQSEYENRTLICSVYTNGTHSYSSATVNVAYNGGNFVLTLGNKISGGSTDIRVSGGYLQYYTPWTSTTNFWRITIN